ncbi:PepSY domain-containing protein [Dyadobacter subterraneus]|uniref:PepSY domain-containing protein n=1 Tax=Dyadobacter subterraneus TaxID=2773304 RepID=A0ABR9WG31_9BACT|nr:PepSY-associated TM helix domain-containing protein [Dyadobacter subterraneus]MBE9464482.1 PepSY domain-containing protein [Dyadobacter subterraneus]
MVRGKFQDTSWFLFQGKASGVSFDPQTGKLIGVSDIAKKSFTDRLEWQIYQLHIGNFGGIFVKILYVLIGLTPGFLSVTGAMLWLKRKNKIRHK